ncbi:MAG TPA: Co2+/Mg2+ efflux protein ApaG [Methylibium sp.]|uniref:Co2+/Mg2+ efflux protein ApaG n=1 Tax=Methylibium sp. TaxID=2067992 RepID=UPI002DBFFF43|nr:Co2+/Mg2+ efflux protein ApaG [Methylibium sp.]HEU4460114.1 Co2+/Mg2+ efflux protein ApaG [Methylibium sp.]
MSRPDFDVSVVARYLPEQSAPEQQTYAFAYSVTITNRGDVAAQLIGRQWHIEDANGLVQLVRGLGVVGHQPLLQPGEQFEYQSWARIATPRGTMRGSYFCMTSEAEAFEAPIAAFSLSMAQALH